MWLMGDDCTTLAIKNMRLSKVEVEIDSDLATLLIPKHSLLRMKICVLISLS